MRRLCERPGCGAPAEVSYGIDRVGCTVWIDNRAVPERELAGRLCRRHADALVVPRGWTVDDRREAVPKLFRVRDVPAEARPPGRRAPKGRAPATAGEPSPPLQFPARGESVAPRAEPVDEVEERALAETSVRDETASVGESSPALSELPADLVYERDDDHAGGHDDDRAGDHDESVGGDDLPDGAPATGDGDDDARGQEETRAFPWSPRLVGAPEPDDPSGPVFGRLLGRAFGRTTEES